MQRVIKFRAWIPKPKNRVYMDDDRTESAPCMFYQDDQYLGSFLRRANTMASEKEHDSYVGEEDMTLLQFTGLHDKNGKEIYEGDVVRNNHGPHIYTFPVVFSRGVFGDEISADQIDPLSELDRDAEYLEVIGNIYENSELIKQS